MNGPNVGRLHVITDETLQQRFSHEQLAEAAVSGGADVVQYREKRSLPAQRRDASARRVVAAVGPECCIINDDVELARRVGAWGVHLGLDDPSPQEARWRWPQVGCVGATANDLERAREVAKGGADYIGVGPVFATNSKARPAPTLGLSGLARIAAGVERPIIAIGGINAANLAAVLAAGAWGVAVLSAVVTEVDPRAATNVLRIRMDECLSSRGVSV
jgi:thiamine-phosphate pyrophosphorylase